MTKLLDSAFQRASLLPEIEQNIFANIILEEIDQEKNWDKSFSNSEDILASMANEAVENYNSKQTEILDIDKL